MRSRRLGRACLLAALPLLSGCAAGSSRPVLANLCDDIPLATYTQAQNSQVADEMDAAPAGAFWPRMIEDYGRQRAEIRACRDASR